MKKTIPKIDTVLAFMRFKGWEVVGKENGYYILRPPKDVKPQTLRYKLPYQETELTYELLIKERIREIADFYSWNKNNLIKLLSKKPNEIDDALQLLVTLTDQGIKTS